MKLNLHVALFVVALFPCAPTVAAIFIDTVPVGNAGNPNDPATGYGAVGYAYNIGTYEVTVEEYTAFLNAVADTDAYNLYNFNMALDANSAGISRSGASGSYTYGVIGSPKRPVTYVDWGDAARFANWLHNGQPTGAQGPGTTETGAYTLDGTINPEAQLSITRNPGAIWFIPSENEWYKAAYYQPFAAGGDSDGYWEYPMKTNSVPYSDQPPGATPNNTRVGNFNHNDGVPTPYNDGYAVTGSTLRSNSVNYLTDVGAYSSSPTYYGTFDQGGNVWEWNEATYNLARGVRGGAWADTINYLQASTRFNFGPSEYSFRGFRVASIPEPGTTILVVVAALTLSIPRRRPAESARS